MKEILRTVRWLIRPSESSSIVLGWQRVSVSTLGLPAQVLGLLPWSAERVEVAVRVTAESGQWLRSFGGRYVESHVRAPREEGAGLLFERVGPLTFGLREVASADGRALELAHEETFLFGLVPLPRSLLALRVTMTAHDDGEGFDLDVRNIQTKYRFR